MKWFSMEELCATSHEGELSAGNVPGVVERENLEALVKEVLDPLRTAMGCPVRVNSGYRCAELNRIVKGASNSQHLRGEAADITVGSWKGNKRMFEYIRYKLPFDQLIDERNYSWIHVSYRRDGRNRGEVLHL